MLKLGARLWHILYLKFRISYFRFKISFFLCYISLHNLSSITLYHVEAGCRAVTYFMIHKLCKAFNFKCSCLKLIVAIKPDSQMSCWGETLLEDSYVIQDCSKFPFQTLVQFKSKHGDMLFTSSSAGDNTHNCVRLNRDAELWHSLWSINFSMHSI